MPADGQNEPDIAALNRSRQQRLLERWSSGARLTASEKDEIAPLIATRPPGFDNPPPSEDPSTLCLEPPLARSPEQYAAEIGASRRTIFRWLAAGRSVNDYCPLDHPADMLAWWDRRMSKRPPACLVRWVEARAASSPPSSSPENSPADPRDAVSVNLTDLHGYGLEAAVVILRRSVEARANALSEAYKSTDDSAQQRAQGKFDAAVEELRKAEKALHDLQKARGDLAPRSEFTTDLVSLASALRGMRRRMPDNIIGALRKSAAAFSEEQLVAVRAAVDLERAAEENLFRNARHWRTLPDGEILPLAAPASPTPSPLAPASV